MDKTLSLIKDYLNIIWAMEHNLGYNLEDFDEKRFLIHFEIANSLRLDYVSTKDILDNLEDSVGIDFSKDLSEADIKNYALEIYDKLANLKEKV